MGENGAGKSTLARICAGVNPADRGDLLLAGEPVTLGNPREAQRLGIAIVHQELDLFPHLTVGENLVIGNLRFPEGAVVDRARMDEFARPFLDQVGLNVGTGLLASALTIAQQQLLVIARALSMHCRILFLDEPTSALT